MLGPDYVEQDCKTPYGYERVTKILAGIVSCAGVHKTELVNIQAQMKIFSSTSKKPSFTVVDERFYLTDAVSLKKYRRGKMERNLELFLEVNFM